MRNELQTRMLVASTAGRVVRDLLTALRQQFALAHPWLRRDLALVAVSSLAGACAVLLDAPLIVRLPAGLLVVLVLPGYALTRALFPDSSLDRPEQATLTGSLSVATIIIMAPILDLLPWGVSRVPMVAAVTIITLAAAVVAWLRGPRIPESGSPPAPTAGVPDPADPATRRSVSLATLMVIGLVLVGLAVTLATRPSAGTEFFALGATGRADTYPTTVQAGMPVTVTLGLRNGEESRQEFEVVARSGPTVLGRAGPIVVDGGDAWSGSITFSLPEPGSDQEVRLELRRAAGADVLRSLRLWLDVLPRA